MINKWIDGVLDKITKLNLRISVDYLDLSDQTEDSGYSRTNPFTSTMTVVQNNYLISINHVLIIIVLCVLFR